MRFRAALSIFLPTCLLAQGPAVGVELDSSIMRIGEQVHLRMLVTYPAGSVPEVQWPAVGDTIGPHVEVISDQGVDTTALDEGLERQLRSVTLTSFDTGYWAIPPFRFIVNGQAMESQAVLLEVRTVELDSTLTLRDLKDIHTLPFSTWYWVRQHAMPIAMVAGALMLVALLVLLLVRGRKPASGRPPVELVIPLHQRILNALDELDRQRVWQQGDHKGYHSRLTDLLRGYIEERYRLPALESTTDELVRELRVSALDQDKRVQLENMLRLADMVKFAKALPSPQENEQMMAGAVRFVRETTPITNTSEHAQ